jgi:hypothetical protein
LRGVNSCVFTLHYLMRATPPREHVCH